MYMDAMPALNAVDVRAMVMRQIDYAQRSPWFPWRGLTKIANALPAKAVLDPVASWAGARLAGYIDGRSSWVVDRTVQLEGAAARLRKSIAASGIYPEDLQLVAVVDKFVAQIARVQESFGQASRLLLARNKQSPLGHSMLRLCSAADGLAAAATLVKQISIGEDWETDAQVQSTRFNMLHDQIRSGDIADMDAELLAMADDAAASLKDDFQYDESWARDLASKKKII
jgi:hypothetical protein